MPIPLHERRHDVPRNDPHCLPFRLLGSGASASGNTQSSIAPQSTPELKVFLYSFPGLSSLVLQGAQAEAASILRGVPIQLQWIDCTWHVPPPFCQLRQATTDLIIRFLPKALPQASAGARDCRFPG